jgi:hypothetical protein
MQFRPPPPPQVSAVRPAKRSSPSDRDCPLDTAGDRCLWHVGGTAGENDDALTWRRRLQLDFSVRPVRGDDCLVGKPRRRRGSRASLWVMSHLSTIPLGAHLAGNRLSTGKLG